MITCSQSLTQMTQSQHPSLFFPLKTTLSIGKKMANNFVGSGKNAIFAPLELKTKRNMKDLKQFIGIYPVSKTLRFELRPIGKTQEWIEKNRVLENDENKAIEGYHTKGTCDRNHRESLPI